MLHQTTFLTIYILTITFILGCALGSFTDCLVGRMLAGTSILKGRSHCDACGHVLGVPDLVPLFSWLCLRGRCRYCGAKIPAESFWAELVSGIACCLIVYRFDVSVLALRGILLWIVLLCLTLTDLHAWIIPDRLQVAGVLIFFGTAVCLPETGAQILRGVLTGAGLSGGMLALSLLFDRLTGKESLGGGDIKLAAATGLVLGLPASLTASILGLGSMCLVCGLITVKRRLHGKKEKIPFPVGPILSCVLGIGCSLIWRKGKIPFGPAIAAAFFLMLLFGEQLTGWYRGLWLL